MKRLANKKDIGQLVMIANKINTIFIVGVKLCVALFITLFINGCVQLVPAKVKQLPGGEYELSVTGVLRAKRETFQNKIDKKSSSLCGGKSLYHYTNKGSYDFQPFQYYYNGSYQKGMNKVFRRIVVCKATPALDNAPSEAGGKVSEPIIP